MISGLVAQWLEHTLDKRGVGGSNPPGPMLFPQDFGPIAQLGERRLCKAEVIGSIPIGSNPGSEKQVPRSGTQIFARSWSREAGPSPEAKSKFRRDRRKTTIFVH